MKKILFYLIVIYAGLSLISFSRGFTQPATGAPGETGASCGQGGCHASGSFSPNPKVFLIDDEGNQVSEYKPGDTYTVSLKINHTGLPSGYGFQMVCLTSADDQAINNFTDLPDGTKELMELNRQYVQQSKTLPVDSISLSWTAPAKETGDLIFYAIANAVNGNSSPIGDGVANTTLVVTEAMNSSISELDNQQLNIYPNPTQDYINVPANISVKEMSLYNLSGQKLYTTNQHTLNISDLTNGQYFIRVMDEANKSYTKLIQKL